MSATLDLPLPTLPTQAPSPAAAVPATIPATPFPTDADADHDADPDPDPDAVVIASALALMGNPLAGLDLQRSYAERIVATVRFRLTNTEILNWRSDTAPAEWDLRWRWARRLTLHHYPAAPGAADLPLDHFTAPQLTAN